jgi:hypothetical protein
LRIYTTFSIQNVILENINSRFASAIWNQIADDESSCASTAVQFDQNFASISRFIAVGVHLRNISMFAADGGANTQGIFFVSAAPTSAQKKDNNNYKTIFSITRSSIRDVRIFANGVSNVQLLVASGILINYALIQSSENLLADLNVISEMSSGACLISSITLDPFTSISFGDGTNLLSSTNNIVRNVSFSSRLTTTLQLLNVRESVAGVGN